jgi:NAD(P)-dependent dehydrogenase (short-subunit alcohol dehydrogenase family)
VAAAAGSIDISFNAISINVVQDIPLVDMSLEDFMAPITDACRTHFVTATTAARHMTAQGSGVIVLLSSTASQESRHQMGGFNLACACIEALTRSLAGEVGRQGARVVGLRPNFTPETVPGVSDEDVSSLLKDTLLGRLPRLAEVADTAVYLASAAAGAMTGAVINLSCGAIID